MIDLEIKLRDTRTLRVWNFTSDEKAKEMILLIEEKYKEYFKHYVSSTGENYDVVYVSLERKKEDLRLSTSVKRSTIYLASFDASIFNEVLDFVKEHTQKEPVRY